MEENKPAEQNVPEAGQEAEPLPVPEPQTPEQNDLKLATELIEGLEKEKDLLAKELTSAQKKIIHLEKNKGGEGDDAELHELVASLQEKITDLEGKISSGKAKEGDELAKLRTRNAELKASLIAKQTAGNASLGTNQDRTPPETDPTKGLTDQQKLLYGRIAARKGMTLKDYLKQNPIKK